MLLSNKCSLDQSWLGANLLQIISWQTWRVKPLCYGLQTAFIHVTVKAPQRLSLHSTAAPIQVLHHIRPRDNIFSIENNQPRQQSARVIIQPTHTTGHQHEIAIVQVALLARKIMKCSVLRSTSIYFCDSPHSLVRGSPALVFCWTRIQLGTTTPLTKHTSYQTLSSALKLLMLEVSSAKSSTACPGQACSQAQQQNAGPGGQWHFKVEIRWNHRGIKVGKAH